MSVFKKHKSIVLKEIDRPSASMPKAYRLLSPLTPREAVFFNEQQAVAAFNEEIEKLNQQN
ncbi:MAG: hypothetical protein IPK23_02075 [Rhizobiales bacterium]|nr:hypothetical protein [Hyphomicrobiales bacterium]